MTLVWEKTLNSNWSLEELQEEPRLLNCVVLYEDKEEGESHSFHFRGWGMDRDSITTRDCWVACQGLMMDDANVTLQTLKTVVDYYEAFFEEEEPDDD